jgi:hypothetical protein
MSEKYLVIDIYQDLPLEPNQINISEFDSHDLAFKYLHRKLYNMAITVNEEGEVFGVEEEFDELMSRLKNKNFVIYNDTYFEIRKY